jgi:peptide/nickel transport system permease protein
MTEQLPAAVSTARTVTPVAPMLARFGAPVTANLALIVSSAYLGVVLLLAFAVQPAVAPLYPDPSAVLKPPSAEHWFGTEQNGFDLFWRVIASARTDIPIAFGGSLLAGLIGIPIGIAVSRNGRWANVFMRGLDLFQSLPMVVVALTVVALAGGGLVNMLVAIALVNTASFIRIARAEAMTVRTHRYIEAVQAMGASEFSISVRHVLPNAMPVLFAELSLASGHSLLTIAGLGFLGVGVEPTTPSWGVMLNNGSQFLATGQWWALLFPILAIVCTVLAFNAVARGLARLLDRSEEH